MSSLEQLVTDLATSQRLKVAGFPQDTALVWFIYGESVQLLEQEQVRTFEKPLDEGIAAPTAEEIEKELPWTLQPWPPTIESAFLRVVKEPDGFRVSWRTWDNKQEAPCDDEDNHYEKESEAAAQAFLWWKKEVAG